jgi:hypothetical protein
MNYILFVLSLTITTYAQFDYCITFGGKMVHQLHEESPSHRVSWSILDEWNIQMRVEIIGAIGWGAVGFNSNNKTMEGANIVLGYGIEINEYYSPGYDTPQLIPKKRISKATTKLVGNNLILDFIRPLKLVNESSFYPITNSILTLMVVGNSKDIPSSNDDIRMHNIPPGHININLFRPSICVEFSLV